jgi:hypothetical protein
LDVWTLRTSRAKTQKEVDSAAARAKTRSERVYPFAERNPQAQAS